MVHVHRLALERGRTAREARDVITGLISHYGQGGAISGNEPDGESYDSAYFILDENETWLVETTEFYWAARQITG